MHHYMTRWCTLLNKCPVDRIIYYSEIYLTTHLKRFAIIARPQLHTFLLLVLLHMSATEFTDSPPEHGLQRNVSRHSLCNSALL